MRSIPTCVGQPANILPIKWVCMVYPHVCGAAVWSLPVPSAALGLSPRVWGSHMRTLSACFTIGSIPTCVGQPATCVRAAKNGEVYPHVCGAAKGNRIHAGFR